MQSAAGGTSQRLKPAFATVCSRSRIPNPAPDTVPALLIDVIRSSPDSHPWRAVLPPTILLSLILHGVQAPILLPRTIFEMRQDRDTHFENSNTRCGTLCRLPSPAPSL